MYNPMLLFKAPMVNPINLKAESIPALNVVNMYGRVWFFSWFGFLIAFWSWYAFPPLLSVTISKDLGMTTTDVLNSNIVGLLATLLVRLIAGPACDKFGPRLTFVGCLLIGAVPTFLAGTCYTIGQLMACRFFVGILGGSFVPCQVWSTGFFDKPIVGTSNAFIAGFGNSGGGITYFLMPAIFDSLVRRQGLTPHVAWRVTFVVPGICIVAVAIAMLLLTDDTPTGKWADRHQAAQRNLQAHGIQETIVDAPTGILAKEDDSSRSGSSSPPAVDEKTLEAGQRRPSKYADHEAPLSEQSMLDTARGEIVVKPTMKEMMHIIITPQTLVCGAAYFCTFGGELAINSILGKYYLRNFPRLGQTGSGNWAAMFGLLNVVFRPIGGLVSDYIYNKTGGSVWAKKYWIAFLCVGTGVFQIVIGVLDTRHQPTLIGLVAGMAFFMDAGNGALFAYVPHVYPQANGVVSGFTGAFGNLGGIICAVIFRYIGTDYAKSFWIIGILTIAMNLPGLLIKPFPKGQIAGR
ncbi:hypothetical protein LTR64_002923 [Lithohypha guttulata]|uniref:Nitrate/nitrite transporter n=1 Tax=Lithohypha guttulata TaxID=1690604 RepID=A0AAN7Y9V4_9EURO|nr:hypothetical protein LTR51_000851 [Lithohypha guttulata]KAK5083943.1 hypothetical protein LTR05_006450 [Lithohypha guttulata]